MNILVNASQAIEEKKEIRISTEVDNGYVEIIISDTGSGMPPDVLYDHGRGERTGLGLNKTIDVESEVEKGTTIIRVQTEPNSVDYLRWQNLEK